MTLDINTTQEHINATSDDTSLFLKQGVTGFRIIYVSELKVREVSK